jgi:DNA-binding MarR family transcriptional regulator
MIDAVKRRQARPPLSTGPAYLLREAHKSLSRVLADELSGMGISFKQYFYLRALFEEDGVSQVELGEAVGMERATVTAVLDTLEREGLVRREPHPDDRRKTNVFLTTKAKKLRAPLLATINRLNRVYLTGISNAEFERMKATLEKMVRNADEYYATEAAS